MRRGVVGGIGWGCGWVAGGGIRVGVKGELSLASPPPLGAGWREIAWAGFLAGRRRRLGLDGDDRTGPGTRGAWTGQRVGAEAS